MHTLRLEQHQKEVQSMTQCWLLDNPQQVNFFQLKTAVPWYFSSLGVLFLRVIAGTVFSERLWTDISCLIDSKFNKKKMETSWKKGRNNVTHVNFSERAYWKVSLVPDKKNFLLSTVLIHLLLCTKTVFPTFFQSKFISFDIFDIWITEVETTDLSRIIKSRPELILAVRLLEMVGIWIELISGNCELNLFRAQFQPPLIYELDSAVWGVWAEIVNVCLQTYRTFFMDVRRWTLK